MYQRFQQFNVFVYKTSALKTFFACIVCNAFIQVMTQKTTEKIVLLLTVFKLQNYQKFFFKKSGKERIPSVYFKNHQKQLPVPFVIYADFESITEKMGQTVADCFLKGKCTRAFPMGKRKYFNVDCD